MVGLCRDFGISRKTGHKWLRRYREHGNASTPLINRTGGLTLAAVEQSIQVALRSRQSTYESFSGIAADR
jgi:transposase-like protein